MTPSFTVEQSPVTPSSFTVVDTSTDVDGTIIKRRLYVSIADGTYLTGNGTVDYDEWDLVDLEITKNILTVDTAANIRVDWLNVDNGIVETLNNNYPLSEFGKQFFVYLVQLQGLAPKSPSDTNYSSNMCLFWTNIVGGDNAVTYGNNISAAQNCYDRLTEMQTKQSLYF